MAKRQPPTDARFGAVHLQRLRAGLLKAADGRPADLMLAAEGAIDFLNQRLTDAAKAGCHHCGEGKPGTPCWWCGLRNRGR